MANWTQTRDALIAAGVSAERLPTGWEPEINLRKADLRGAYLSNADLSEADGPFTIGYFGRHHAVAAGGYIAIGCERHTYDEWLERYEEIGAENGYTPDEIADYGEWIKLAVARQRRIEGIEKE